MFAFGITQLLFFLPYLMPYSKIHVFLLYVGIGEHVVTGLACAFVLADMCMFVCKCRQQGTPMVNLTVRRTVTQDVTNQQHMAAVPGLCFEMLV